MKLFNKEEYEKARRAAHPKKFKNPKKKSKSRKDVLGPQFSMSKFQKQRRDVISNINFGGSFDQQEIDRLCNRLGTSRKSHF